MQAKNNLKNKSRATRLEKHRIQSSNHSKKNSKRE